MAKKTKPQSVLRMSVNGHTLTGEKRRGRWTFACNTWPDIAELHEGSADCRYALDEFAARVVAEAVTVIEG